MREGRIDYRMRRRATLKEVHEGLTAVTDVCDAHPDLVRAGRHIGTEVDDACPICEKRQIRQVTYVFTRRPGDKAAGGRAVPRDSLLRQVKRFGDLNVFTVEVCIGCHWHHLLESFWLRPQGRVVV